MSSAGAKSKRYYVSKNFYRYVRPGAVRMDAAASEASKLYPLAFQHATEASKTIVIINDNKTETKAVRLVGTGLGAQYKVYATTATDDAADKGVVNSSDVIVLPANSVVTLYSEN
jgi:O-glycosyl hydrolase